MRLNEKLIKSALYSGRTRTWDGIICGAMDLLEKNTIAKYAGVMIVEDKVWREFTKRIGQLPANGHRVLKEYNTLCWRIKMARTQFD